MRKILYKSTFALLLNISLYSVAHSVQPPQIEVDKDIVCVSNISVSIAKNREYQKSGAGEWQIDCNNKENLLGTLNVAEGTLSISQNYALGDTGSTLVLKENTTLKFKKSNIDYTQENPLLITSNINLSNASVIEANQQFAQFKGTISGTNDVNSESVATLTGITGGGIDFADTATLDFSGKIALEYLKISLASGNFAKNARQVNLHGATLVNVSGGDIILDMNLYVSQSGAINPNGFKVTLKNLDIGRFKSLTNKGKSGTIYCETDMSYLIVNMYGKHNTDPEGFTLDPDGRVEKSAALIVNPPPVIPDNSTPQDIQIIVEEHIQENLNSESISLPAVDTTIYLHDNDQFSAAIIAPENSNVVIQNSTGIGSGRDNNALICGNYTNITIPSSMNVTQPIVVDTTLNITCSENVLLNSLNGSGIINLNGSGNVTIGTESDLDGSIIISELIPILKITSGTLLVNTMLNFVDKVNFSLIANESIVHQGIIVDQIYLN